MIVVGNQARISGSKRFKVGKYDGGSSLSEKMVFWLKIRDNDSVFMLVLIFGD